MSCVLIYYDWNQKFNVITNIWKNSNICQVICKNVFIKFDIPNFFENCSLGWMKFVESQLTISCSKLAVETLEKVVKYVQS